MNEYYNSMDREVTATKAMRDVDKAFEIGVDELGTTTNPFEHQTQALKARIFHGASRVEFEFFGQGKGQKERATPGTFGSRERRDMRELAEFNKVQTSTHASVGVQGLSGLNMQQHVFSDDQRKQAIDEIKRAVHFASEASTGGAIVFHTGEAPRYMHGRWENPDGSTLFEMYPDEDKRKVTYLVDPIAKRLVGQISDIDKIAIPKLRKDENGKQLYLTDENNEYVVDDLMVDYDHIHGGKIPEYQIDKDGNIQTEVIDYREFKKRRIKELQETNGGRTPSEEELTKDFFFQQKFLEVQYNLYFGKGSESRLTDNIKTREKIIKSLNYYKKLKENVPEDEWWRFQETRGNPYMSFIPPDTEDPVKYLQQKLLENTKDLSHNRELATHGRRAARETLDMVQRSELADSFAMDESARSMAELGVYTWQMNEKTKSDFKKGKTPYALTDDLYLAPENLFPEMSGSHPDELKEFVLKGRKAMEDSLVSTWGKKRSEARELSKKHIKATFDIGHANVWRKYFKSKPGESLDSRDDRFNKWLLTKTQELVDEGIVGHIHISDNYGFNDEHLVAGDGNAPIKEFVRQAKKAGLSEFIIESGSFNAMNTLPDTWMHFDSPVYGMHVAGFTQDSWTDPSVSPRGFNQFYRQHFGRTEGPRYLVGDTAPSEDFKGAPFYSGIGLE